MPMQPSRPLRIGKRIGSEELFDPGNDVDPTICGNPAIAEREDAYGPGGVPDDCCDGSEELE